MADLLLNKVINDELDLNVFKKWICSNLSENQDEYKAISTFNVTRMDFVTFFLNFIHEEVPCNRVVEIPQKVNTPKRIDKVQIHRDSDVNKSVRTNLFMNVDNANKHSSRGSNSLSTSSVEKRSTPKHNKTPNIENSSYCSPVSPLYENPNSSGNKDNRSGTRKSADKHSLCLGDFIVVNQKNLSKKKKNYVEPNNDKKAAFRRIKPTSVVHKNNNDFQKTENSFNFQENVEEVTVESAIEQRNALVEERMKIISRKDCMEKNTHPLLSKRHSSSSKPEIRPSLNDVTFKTHIECMVSIYSTILKSNMVLNITSEIYFLISLLLSKQTECYHQTSQCFELNSSREEYNLGVNYLEQFPRIIESAKDIHTSIKTRLYNSEMFENIHNVVYFAVKCLEDQIEAVKLYDKTTIRSLAENERLILFAPHFSSKLLTYSDKMSEKSCVDPVTPVSLNNVCFMMDTDGKENFPDQNSFHAFRKQRDLFYDILRLWETQHLSSDWNFSLRLSGKIKSLLGLNREPTNYIHLARLFKNQLLSSCVKGPKEKGLSESNLAFLPSVNIDPDKLNRLTNRLVTKQSSNGINSLPVFKGYQEFYKDFILVASNCFFNKHLCDSLIYEILELNDSKFSGIDIEEDNNDVDPSIRKKYSSCIKNLRILAKFLGFIESLPYRSEFTTMSKTILESQIKLRNQFVPGLDVQSILSKSQENSCLILVIPWLTKYLSMLDYVTIRLPYYMSIHKILFDIYKNCDQWHRWKYNVAVIKLGLGWLFELPHFPESEYFNYLSTIGHTYTIENEENSSKSNENTNATRSILRGKGLDHLNITNQGILYLCCPYLEEIKKLLSMDTSSNVAVKHITPVTAVESNTAVARKKLEEQLEEAFFNGQPVSLRKTVEFVSERIASSAVKYICHDLVPLAKEKALKELKEDLLDSYTKNSNDDPEKNTTLRKQAVSLAQNHLTNLLNVCNEEMQNISGQKIPASIDSLLPIDTLDETKNVCVGIADKMYTERVKQWLNSHLNLTVFTKDFDSEVQKVINGKKSEKDKAPFLLPPAGRNNPHNENTSSGFHIYDRIRETCCELIEGNYITPESIYSLLEETYKSITERNDVNDMLISNICMTLFDLFFLINAKQPFIMNKTNTIRDHFISIWRLHNNPSSFFKSLVCPRNVTIFERSKSSTDSWINYAYLLFYLSDNKIIPQEEIEAQCTGFYTLAWDQEIYHKYARFVSTFLNCSFDVADDAFVSAINFLLEFCNEIF